MGLSPLFHRWKKGSGAMDPNTQSAFATSSQKGYFALAVGQAVVVSALVITVFAEVEQNIPYQTPLLRTIPVYLAIFVLAELFSCLFVYDALRARNIVQIFLHLIFMVALFVYSILQISQTRHALQDQDTSGRCDDGGEYWSCIGKHSLFDFVQRFLIAIPVFIGVSGLGMFVVTFDLYQEFGWTIFAVVGGSPELKRLHRQYQTLLSLLKLLLFFAVAFCLAFLILVTSIKQNKAEFVITIVALPVAAVVMLLTGWALRTENKPVMGASLVFMVAGLVYFIYKLASMWLPRTKELYNSTRATMAVLSIVSIVLLLITFIYSCLCMSNFDKGLIQAHQNPVNKTSLLAMQQTQGQTGISEDPHRITIE